MLAGAAPAHAQVASSTASVSLVAHVQESFALIPAVLPPEQAEAANPDSGPKALHVVLNWRLRPGRTFQVGYELADEVGGLNVVSSEGTISPSRVQDTVPVFSFLPRPPHEIQAVAAWGNRETDPAGAAGILLNIPLAETPTPPVLRLRAIIL
jgi:hypothetical protein